MPIGRYINNEICRWLPVVLLSIGLGGCEQGPVEPADSASPLRVRLMTGQQYANAISEIFGADISEPSRRISTAADMMSSAEPNDDADPSTPAWPNRS